MFPQSCFHSLVSIAKQLTVLLVQRCRHSYSHHAIHVLEYGLIAVAATCLMSLISYYSWQFLVLLQYSSVQSRAFGCVRHTYWLSIVILPVLEAMAEYMQ